MPRQYQIGSSSVENYEQIKKDYSCEMNQTTVSTFSISFGIKHLLQFIFLLFLGLQLRRQGRSPAIQHPVFAGQSKRSLERDEDGEGWVTKGSTHLDLGLDTF